MTQHQCYISDTYCLHLASSVLVTGNDEYGHWIALEENIFHPQGGGQPADSGWVNNVPVKVKRQPSGLIVLYPEKTLDVVPGEKVEASVSQSERLLNTALHSAGHLLNWELRRYGWLAKTGHHFPGESRVEFTAMGSDTVPVSELPLAGIETSMQEKIKANLPVKTWIENEIRFCLIEGTEAMPCAGTHVKTLGSIVEFSIKAVKLKKSTLRISYDATHGDLRSDYAE
ncbi:hypothetical protein LGZ99_01975 [Photorhabdus temperata]|uniref:hypothetical protein n=1 Tax=Photorhabdus temperata TaxID=574560 RepID=UPI0021D48B26|nr:hypothetical protein [Photorhabdus temperata]MCT8346014.1 hypothetical protein [Photorhabdus temperata]